ncbi:MAG TPA: methyltransferase domain-containing protein [Casimicrobiaceae bacterium]|nr:methyltransferase domain-containing protein [Casimicrobiaceae bacterium]
MAHIGLLPVIYREVARERQFPREPEPDLVMDDPEQVRAYADAGRADGLMAAAYLFHTARISQVIQGCREVVDLGCGPATQLCQVAALHPTTRFTGVDLSPSMLASAKAHVAQHRVDNVALVEGDITGLGSFATASVDGVISTLALHHLPTVAHLEACFDEISRVLRPGGAIYIADFGRLKSLKSVLYFAYMNAKHQPHVFSLDYERSLRAAFLADELRTLAARKLPANVRVHCTFLAPLLVAIQTEPKSLPGDLKSRLIAMRRRLPRRYRIDLDELRQFFRLGGLPGDAFR